MNHRYSYPISVKAFQCANGETHEFVLMVGDMAVRRIWRSVRPNESVPHAAAAALAEMLAWTTEAKL